MGEHLKTITQISLKCWIKVELTFLPRSHPQPIGFSSRSRYIELAIVWKLKKRKMKPNIAGNMIIKLLKNNHGLTNIEIRIFLKPYLKFEFRLSSYISVKLMASLSGTDTFPVLNPSLREMKPPAISLILSIPSLNESLIDFLVVRTVGGGIVVVLSLLFLWFCVI